MHLQSKTKNNRYRKFLPIVVTLLMVSGLILPAAGFAADKEASRQAHPLFDVLYYNAITDTGVIVDKQGVAIDQKGVFFEVEIKNYGPYKITILEGYPEDLPPPETHIDDYPETAIKKMLQTFPKYNVQ